MENKIVVLGEQEEIIPFMGSGVDIYLINNVEQFKDKVMAFIKEKYTLILISNNYIELIPEIVNQFSKSTTTTITSIPDKNGNSTFTKNRLNKIVKKAIGIDI